MYTSTYICIHIHTYVRRCVAANAHSKPLLLPSSTFPINQGCTSQTIPTARPTWLDSLLPPAQHGESPCHMRRAFLTPKDSTGQESRILRKSATRVFVLLRHSAPPFADHAHHSTNVTWHHLFHVVPQSIFLCPPQTFRPIVRRSLSCHMSTCGATETSSTSMSPAGGG